jgi:CRP-like cAMP-binding protein
MTALTSYLTTHPLFADLDKAYLDIVLRGASHVKFDPEQYIFRENQPADRFFLLRHGRVALEIGPPGEERTLTIQHIETGEVLGWSWLVPPYKWHFDARAVWQTRAIALDGKYIRQRCEEQHDFGYALFKRFSPIIMQRLQATRLQLLEAHSKHGSSPVLRSD